MDRLGLLTQNEFLASLPDDLLREMTHSAQERMVEKGEVLIYVGDSASVLYLLVEGDIDLAWSERYSETARPGMLIDAGAVLSGQPHGVRAVARSECRLLRWSADALNESAAFREAAREYLGRALRHAQDRVADLSAKVHHGAGAAISPGPFLFDSAVVLFVFCDADLSVVHGLLPYDLSLLGRQAHGRAPVMIGLADFPTAYPENNPKANFGYTETTVFVPVRFEATPGVFIPYIYPSAWEPILIGREVYGLPKQLGHTEFGIQEAAMSIDGMPALHLNWDAIEGSNEAKLVGALMGWLGIERNLSTAAFQIGDAMRQIAGLPAHRRVDVFARKRIPAVDSTPSTRLYDVDHLTQAVFGVMGWRQVSKLKEPRLTVGGSPLAELNLRLHEAYRTRLDMRLSTGRIVRDYKKSQQI